MRDAENLGRILTVEECDWLNIRGLHLGYDVDTCEPQLNHIVVVYDSYGEKVEPICGATTLWFHDAGWGGPRASGDYIEEDRRLKCVGCLAKFEDLYRKSQDRTHRGFAGTLLYKKHSDALEELISATREVGRHDLAMLLDAVRVAYLVESEISESTLRHLMQSVLSLKRERIARAMELLREADGE